MFKSLYLLTFINHSLYITPMLSIVIHLSSQETNLWDLLFLHVPPHLHSLQRLMAFAKGRNQGVVGHLRGTHAGYLWLGLAEAILGRKTTRQRTVKGHGFSRSQNRFLYPRNLIVANKSLILQVPNPIWFQVPIYGYDLGGLYTWKGFGSLETG
jgi:hypothetical protein